MQEDPVDTWELGRNDAVESITGTRNVFVDYPELGFLMFGVAVPAGYQTPSGSALNGTIETAKPSDTTRAPETTQTPTTTNPTSPTYVSIKSVRALAENATAYTEGVIVFIENKNGYQNVAIFDGEAGLNLYVKPSNSNIKIGDRIKVHGTRGAYNGLEQLKNITIDEVVSSNNSFTYKETTISAIKADQGTGDLESTPVLLKGVTIGTVNTTGNTAVTDAAGNTINIYSCPQLSGISAGDKVDIKCIVSDFYGYQLRVSYASDITKASEETKAPETTKTPDTTNAPETTKAPVTTEEQKSEGGCGSVVGGVAVVALIGIAFIVSKKKD